MKNRVFQNKKVKSLKLNENVKEKVDRETEREEGDVNIGSSVPKLNNPYNPRRVFSRANKTRSSKDMKIKLSNYLNAKFFSASLALYKIKRELE